MAIRPTRPPQRVGKKLVAEAEPDVRHAPLDDGFADRGFFGDQPSMNVFFEDVHRSAHYPENVVVGQWRNRLSRIELDGIPGDAVGIEEVSEYAGMLDVDMLKY